MHATEPTLSAKQRQEIESRLANYNIPAQIMQMVAEHCGCDGTLAALGSGTGEAGRPGKSSKAFGRLNDRSIILLQQIFLECRDSFSNFRLAVFLSSRWSPVSYKFTMGEKVEGKTKKRYAFDVCVHNRNTGELVAVGMQNNDAGQKASGSESLRQFMAAVGDLRGANPALHSAYYASSYGYEGFEPPRAEGQQDKAGQGNVEVMFLEYRDMVYFERKPDSRRAR